MSHVSISYLYCDGPICDGHRETMYSGIGPGDTIADQRKRAKIEGWLVAQPGGKDYCAECAEHLRAQSVLSAQLLGGVE